MENETQCMPKKSSSMVTVLPLKDHVISQNEFHIVLKKDEMVEVPKRFLQVLLTEKVISSKG